MPQLIGVLIYFGLIAAFFVYVAPVIFVLALLGAATLVTHRYAVAMWAVYRLGGGAADAPSGLEPAFKQYFFRKAFLDYREVARTASKACQEDNRDFWDWVEKMFGAAGCLTWPMGLTLVGVGLAAIIGAGLFFLLAGATHLAVVVTVAAGALAVAGTMRVAERGLMAVRRIFLACPNGGCYQRVALPTFLCPKCGAEHKRLVPGSYGVLARRCRCGESLPTSFLRGRQDLPSICPHCRGPIKVVLARNVHIPVVGGPSAGKTSLLYGVMRHLQVARQAGTLAVSFPDHRHEQVWNAADEALVRGEAPAKTAALMPDAFQVQLTPADGRSCHLHLYDAAGESYQQSDAMRAHGFNAYIHGIVFLIDPFSLPALSRTASVPGDVRASEEQPQAVYDRMVGNLVDHRAGRRGVSKVPLAVVVTKLDALKELGADAPEVAGNESREVHGSAVRDWLVAHGEGNLVRGLEKDFTTVQYFTVAALGRDPSAAGAFVPLLVDVPLAWLLGLQGITMEVSLEPKVA